MAEPTVSYEEAQLLYRAGFGMARRLGQDEATSTDLAQEAVVRAMADWERVRDRAVPWVNRVVTNLVIDDWRRRHRVARLLRRPVTHESTGEVSLDLVQALGQLPRRQRESVVFRYLMDLSQEDTANAMGCSVGSVSQHTSRGLQTLRVLLGPDYPITTGGLSDA